MTNNQIQLSIQDQIGPENNCHGCGPNNPHGLRIKSYMQGQAAICNFTPQAHHCAGSKEIVNGGIIASLLDCHSINLCMADAYLQAGREIGSEPKLWYVTASLNISYLKPTPLKLAPAAPIVLNARIIKREGRKSWAECELSVDGTVCVKAEVLGIGIKR